MSERAGEAKLDVRRTRNRVVAGLVLGAALAGGVWWWARPGRDAGPTGASTAGSIFRREVRAPEGVRITVQVLNATASRGLARRAQRQLREAGFDVVEIGTVPAAQRRDSTLVLARSGKPEWAQLVADALGGGAVQSRPDSSRYLDVTVLLGASYRPPPETLYP